MQAALDAGADVGGALEAGARDYRRLEVVLALVFLIIVCLYVRLYLLCYLNTITYIIVVY